MKHTTYAAAFAAGVIAGSVAYLGYADFRLSRDLSSERNRSQVFENAMIAAVDSANSCHVANPL